MARLTGPPDHVFDLHPISYEFPEANSGWDANWIVVRIAVTDGRRRWSATDPAFLTWELNSLVRWLRGLAHAAPDLDDSFGAIEPNLEFKAEVRGEGVRLRALFSHEFHPEWAAWRSSGRKYDLSQVGVDFRPGLAGLRSFADDLGRELSAFLERSP
jgi:hypothetical protein